MTSGPDEYQLDPLFEELQEKSQLLAQRSLLEVLCKQFEPYAGENFQSELRHHLTSRFWEMHLACAFLNGGFELLPRNERPDGGPDICILQKGSRLWIETVAPSRGGGADSVPEPETQHGLVSEDKIILRFRSAITDRFGRYQEYLARGLVKKHEPFLIAVNGALIHEVRSRSTDDLPYPILAVLPFGPSTVQIDRNTREKTGEGFAYRMRIIKESRAGVQTDIFLDRRYAGISALLFSNVDVFSAGRASLKDVSLLHNPSRTHALPGAWLDVGLEWWVENNALHCRPGVGHDRRVTGD